MTKFRRIFIIGIIFLMVAPHLRAQVNTVAFGKNRVQYKKLKWKIYQSQNFEVYFNGDGESLAKYVMQAAEAALPVIESAAEYSFNRSSICSIW
jgi:hypothetical protein